jgi:hypothetical protein
MSSPLGLDPSPSDQMRRVCFSVMADLRILLGMDRYGSTSLKAEKPQGLGFWVIFFVVIVVIFDYIIYFW